MSDTMGGGIFVGVMAVLVMVVLLVMGYDLGKNNLKSEIKIYGCEKVQSTWK